MSILYGCGAGGGFERGCRGVFIMIKSDEIYNAYNNDLKKLTALQLIRKAYEVLKEFNNAK